MKLMVKNRRRTTCVAPNGRSTTNRGSSQQISSPPQMFSKATELNSHVTRLCSLIQRSIHQSLLLTRNRGGVVCNVSMGRSDEAFVGLLVTTEKRVITTRVGSIGITAIIVHFKESFEKGFDALMTLTASIEQFYYMTYECDFITKWA